jgi:hypothetical protein
MPWPLPRANPNVSKGMRTVHCAAWLASCLVLSGAELSIPGIVLSPGGAGTAGIHLASRGGRLASLQVDLHYDAANIEISPVAGPASAAGGKIAGVTEIAFGTKRILVMGFDRRLLADGIVISLLVSSISGQPGSYPLRLSDALAADADANAVPLGTLGGFVSVAGDGERENAAAKAFGEVASGGAWRTTFTLLNTSSVPGKARLTFWGGDGQPLALPLAFPGAGYGAPRSASFVDCSLDPGAMFVFETEAPDALEPLVGWAELEGGENIVGFAVLRAKSGSDRHSEAMLPLDRQTGRGFVVPYDNTADFETGVAIANRDPDSPADLELVFRDEAGGAIWIESLSLPARGHTSFPLGGRFPALVGHKGILEVHGHLPAGITVLSLRFDSRGSFTPLPVFPKNTYPDPSRP